MTWVTCVVLILYRFKFDETKGTWQALICYWQLWTSHGGNLKCVVKVQCSAVNLVVHFMSRHICKCTERVLNMHRQPAIGACYCCAWTELFQSYVDCCWVSIKTLPWRGMRCDADVRICRPFLINSTYMQSTTSFMAFQSLWPIPCEIGVETLFHWGQRSYSGSRWKRTMTATGHALCVSWR